MMAQMTIYSPDNLMLQLSRLGDVDEYAPEILNEGIDPLFKKIKENAEKHRRTGEMAKSLKKKKAKKDKRGTWKQRVQFEGYDKTRKPTKSDPRGVPNARKAMSLEYGTKNQPATPFIRPAIIQSEKECIERMQERFNSVVDKIKG